MAPHKSTFVLASVTAALLTSPIAVTAQTAGLAPVLAAILPELQHHLDTYSLDGPGLVFAERPTKRSRHRSTPG